MNLSNLLQTITKEIAAIENSEITGGKNVSTTQTYLADVNSFIREL